MFARLCIVGSLALFLASALRAGEPPARKDFTQVDPKTLGVEFVAPMKDSATGFVVGGVNDSLVIAKAGSFNGRTIEDLERDMRPGGLSTLGFLGKDERLIDILALDNRDVVETRKLTHQDLARPLHVVGAIALAHGLKEPVEFVYRGTRFKGTAQTFRGVVHSPFEDGTKTNAAVKIWNQDNGKTLSYSLLVPHLIERYGFYEGKGTPYRVEPGAILEAFEFLGARK
jgi:hypothetical protein